MSPVHRVAEIFDAIQQAKAGARAFCTNFFPVQARLQNWIDHEQVMRELRDGVIFFLRKDRDFWHLYFCADNPTSLAREIPTLSSIKTEPIVLDLVGNETALADLIGVFEALGFRRYARLVRLARATGHPLSPADRERGSDCAPELSFATTADSPSILGLLESSFDRYADQLPMRYEIEAAIADRQILVIRISGDLAALLFFETRGLTSTVRYWTVAEAFRSHRLGSALMRHYFAAQNAVRRFILWVTANNENALQKYRHYGYVPDGLVDYVLANALIRP
jgi:hypothetical protein